MRYTSRQAPMLNFILLNNAFIFCSTKTQHCTHFDYIRISPFLWTEMGPGILRPGASPEGMVMKTHDSFEWVNIAVFSETISSGPHLRSKNSTPSLILLVLGLLCLVRDFGGRSSNASQHPGCRYINRREVQLRAGVLKISQLYITAFSLLSPILFHSLPFVPISGP